MNNRSPSNRTPSNRQYGGMITQLKQVAENITIGLGEVVTKTLITPVKKFIAENITVYLSELSFVTKQTEPTENYWILLDDTLNKVRSINADEIISPLVIEDSTTGENTLEFAFPIIDPDNIIEGGQVILIKDADGDWQPYLVKEVTISVTGNGEQILRVKCDHLFYELMNGLPQNHSYTNNTPAQALASALDDTRWQVGNIDASITDLVTISGSFYNPLRIVRQIESELVARLKFRAVVGATSITGLYVDIQEIDYEFSGQRFEFGYNLHGIDITVDSSRVYTALTGIVPGQLTDPVTEEAVPLTFADTVWTIAGGDPADKPATQTWVGNEAARLLYGIYNPDTGLMDHRFGIYDSGASTTSEGLLDATWLIGTRYHFAPKVNIEASVADLSKVKFVNVITGLCETFDNDKIRVGNICYVIAENHGLLAAVDVRIIRIERYLKEPTRTRVIFGDALFAGSDFLRELQDEVDSKTRRRAQAPDRGPGAAVTIASADTSLFPEYADIIVPAASVNFEQYFHAAIDDLPLEGGQILILEGKYVYSDTMTIDMDNVTVTGQGEGTVIKLVDGMETDTEGFYALNQRGIKIQDLVIDGDKVKQGAGLARGIHFDYSDANAGNWAWYNSGATSTGSVAGDRTYGWRFTVNETLVVNRLRIKSYNNATYKLNLWSSSTGTSLATVNVVGYSSGGVSWWSFAELSSSVTLVTGTEYRISFDYTASTTENFRADINITSAEFDSRINYLNSVYAVGKNTYPSLDDTASIGIVDFGFVQDKVKNTDFAIQNVIIRNHTFQGMYVDSGANAEIINCKVYDNDNAGIVVGTSAAGIENIRILGNEINNNGTIGMFIFADGSYAKDVLIQNNSLISNVDAGLLCYGMVNCSIVGNTCRQAGGTSVYNVAGMIFAYCEENNIIGNVSSGNDDWGISVENSNKNLVSNNTCNDSVDQSGIILDDSSTYNTVQGNKCQGNNLYGIVITAGSNNNQVTNNDLYGNGSGGLSDAGTGTITAAGNRS